MKFTFYEALYLIAVVAIAFGVRWASRKLNPVEKKTGQMNGDAASNPDSTLKQTEPKNNQLNKSKGGTK